MPDLGLAPEYEILLFCLVNLKYKCKAAWLSFLPCTQSLIHPIMICISTIVHFFNSCHRILHNCDSRVMYLLNVILIVSS